MGEYQVCLTLVFVEKVFCYIKNSRGKSLGEKCTRFSRFSYFSKIFKIFLYFTKIFKIFLDFTKIFKILKIFWDFLSIL